MRATLTLAVVAGALCRTAAADDVYRNIAFPQNSFNALVPAGQASGPERGNTVTLAGPARSVTSVAVEIRIGNSGVATFNATVRLYANNGPGGSPGALLWDSGPRPFIIDSGADLLYTFPIPGGVVVPPVVTWTVRLSGRAGQNQAALGPAYYNPPTIGSAAAGIWENSGAGWSLVSLADPPLGARLTACYANCDGSTAAPNLNIADFTCFIQKFAASDPYANCDSSTAQPVLNVGDFTCFLQKFAQGCL